MGRRLAHEISRTRGITSFQRATISFCFVFKWNGIAYIIKLLIPRNPRIAVEIHVVGTTWRRLYPIILVWIVNEANTSLDLFL